MHDCVRLEVFNALIDEIRVPEVPFVETDLLSEHFLESREPFLHG
jgi:hypothetical protein